MNGSGTSEATTGSVEVDGATLRFRREGQGPPCIVLANAVYYPKTFSQNLRRHLELVFADLRHWVPSAPDLDISGVTVDVYAADIDTIRRALGLDRVFVIGHSIHGTIALEYARRYPQHVLGVVVVGGVPAGMGEAAAAMQQFWEADASAERKSILKRKLAELEPELPSLSPSDQLVRTYVARSPLYWYDPEYDCAWIWEGTTVNMPMTMHLFTEMFGDYNLAGQPPVSVPALVIEGRYDYVAPSILWDRYIDALPEAEYHLFENSGHTPQLEEPERFDELVTKWIRSVEAR
jgi:proline iminopeptidase